MRNRLLILLAVVALCCGSMGWGVYSVGFAQGTNCKTFSETGQTICDRFLDYWNGHGGLSQQGYPISGAVTEANDTDGKTYTVQYFERATFEMHPENPAPNDVLLSLLGVFLYQQKYPPGAPGQEANNSAGSVIFAETGKRLGGIFLDYWKSHGALAQQGLPISDEFVEVNDLDGKSYRVQYFERAVFEYHPEQVPAYQVLLSQLGTFRYKLKYQGGAPPAAATSTPVTGAPTATTPPSAPTQPPSGGNPPLSCTAAAGQYCAAAAVSNGAPADEEAVQVTGRLMKDGQAIPGAAMHATWHYKTTTVGCDASATDSSGYANCTRTVGHPAKRFTVVIDVDFVINGAAVAHAQTQFTP